MKPRILIFEDNEILRSTLKQLLELHGYEVFSFADPGLCPVDDSTNHNCPLDHACADIIISDVDMPTKTGLEIMKERKQRGCKTKYRALMSGDWTDSNLKYAQEIGCRVFHKPFDLDELIHWLHGCKERIEPGRRLSNFLSKSTGTVEKNQIS